MMRQPTKDKGKAKRGTQTLKLVSFKLVYTPVKNIIPKSSYNWFKIDILNRLHRPLTAN